MAVILQITEGPAQGRRTFLRSGQVLRIGRTERADFDVPQDPAMAPLHFAVEYDAGACRVRDLQSGAATLVNGESVADAIVSHGDRITAGATTFRVQIDDAGGAVAPAAAAVVATAAVAAAAPPAAAPGASGFRHVAAPLAADVCKKFELDDDAKKLLDDRQTSREFFTLLAKRKLYSDAARFMAHALPKREAIWWACHCVRSALGEHLTLTDRRALDAADRWTLDPTEPARRDAESAAEATRHETAAGWAAAAVFWSGGSIAPAGAAEVPPKESLAAQAVVVAIKLSATSDPPRKAPERHAEFLALAARVADGDSRWLEK